MPIAAARYVHTNLIAHDAERLARFYESVFGCVRVPPSRDLSGDWLSLATGIPNAHLVGHHLRLPGHGPSGPTLEIFSYAEVVSQALPAPNRAGYGHLAFSVPDVEQALSAVVEAGGSALGDVVRVGVPDAGELCFVYARDPEGNILELQRWGDPEGEAGRQGGSS
jgi:glyoxylase I family protein